MKAQKTASPLYFLRLAEELVQLMKKGPLNPDAMNVSVAHVVWHVTYIASL